MGRRKVEVGQRFERLGRWSRTWQVDAIIEGPGRMRNAVLHDVAEPANRCTLAPKVLLDRKRFRFLDPQSTHPDDETQSQHPPSKRGDSPAQQSPSTASPLPRSRREQHMAIESRVSDGYTIVCSRQGDPHRFTASYPDGRVTCPSCGYAASAVSLLVDYNGRRREDAWTVTRPKSSKPVQTTDPPRESPMAKILTLPRKRATA